MSEYTAENNWGEVQRGTRSAFSGTKYSNRPAAFGQSVTCESSLEVVPSEVTIGGHVFVPKVMNEVVDGGVIGADGEVPETSLTHVVLSAEG